MNSNSLCNPNEMIDLQFLGIVKKVVWINGIVSGVGYTCYDKTQAKKEKKLLERMLWKTALVSLSQLPRG